MKIRQRCVACNLECSFYENEKGGVWLTASTYSVERKSCFRGEAPYYAHRFNEAKTPEPPYYSTSAEETAWEAGYEYARKTLDDADRP
jgi:hypothetical protein